MSKPVSRNHITLFLYTAKSPKIVGYPLLDLVKLVESDASNEEQTVANKWWDQLREEQLKQKEKKKVAREQKKIIKHEINNNNKQQNSTYLGVVLKDVMFVLQKVKDI